MLPAPCLSAGCRKQAALPAGIHSDGFFTARQLRRAQTSSRRTRLAARILAVSSASRFSDSSEKCSVFGSKRLLYTRSSGRTRNLVVSSASVEKSSVFGTERHLSGPKKLLEDMPAPTRYVTCTAIVAGALMAGYAVGSQAKDTPNAALAGALALGAVGGATAFVVNSMAPEVAATKLHNLLVNHPDPKSLTPEEVEAVLRKFGIDRRNEKFNTELRNLYDSFVTSVIPPGNEDLKGDEAAVIKNFKDALGLDDPDAASVHIEIGRRIVRQRLETGDRETAVEERLTFQKLVYVSSLVFGEASKFLLPWKRVFKVTDSQVEIAVRDNAQRLFAASLSSIGTDLNIEQLKELRRTQLKVQLPDEIASNLVKTHTQKLLEGYISRALEVLKARTRIKDTKKVIMELENMLAYNDLLSSLAKDASDLVPGVGPASVIGGQYDSDRQMDDLKLLYRTYLTEAVLSDGHLVKEKLPTLAQLKNVFCIGNHEADEIILDITAKVYRRRLSQAVTNGDLEAATSKASYLQNLCNSLQFDPAKAAKVHEEIYRQKLEQCVSDGGLSDEDIKALLRLRVLLCIPQETVEAAHADICGRIFSKVVDTAIASGVDGYDPEMTASVRSAVQGLRLSQKAAMEIAGRAVRNMFKTYIRRSRTADSRTESARELKKMIIFNNLVVTDLVDNIKNDPANKVLTETAKKEEKVEEVEYLDDDLEMLQSLRKTKPDKMRETSGKDPQKEITLGDELPLRDRTDLYRTYLIYCLTGETTHMPFGSSIVVQRDASEFERLGELGNILGLTPLEIGNVHKGLAEQAFKQQAEIILADGKLLPQKMEQLVEVQKQLGLPSDSFQKVVHNIATTKMAGAIDAAVRQGELKLEEVKEMREAGIKIDTMISKNQREKMYRRLVETELSSGKGEFDETKFYETYPTELELDATKCKTIVEELAKQRLKSSLVQAAALLRQRNPDGVISELTNLLLCDKLVRSETKLAWSVQDELKDLYCLYMKGNPGADKLQRLQELFGFDVSTAQALEDFVATNGFSLTEEEEVKF